MSSSYYKLKYIDDMGDARIESWVYVRESHTAGSTMLFNEYGNHIIGWTQDDNFGAILRKILTDIGDVEKEAWDGKEPLTLGRDRAITTTAERLEYEQRKLAVSTHDELVAACEKSLAFINSAPELLGVHFKDLRNELREVLAKCK